MTFYLSQKAEDGLSGKRMRRQERINNPSRSITKNYREKTPDDFRMKYQPLLTERFSPETHPGYLKRTLKKKQISMEDHEKTPDAVLLEEVFNEIESSELLKNTNTSKLGFLEDLFNTEKKSLAGSKNPSRKEKESSESIMALKSAIHEGLTDSSEDEDNRYFEERRYNECGRVIRNLIKENWKSDPVESEKTEGGWRKSKSGDDLKKELGRFSSTSNEKQSLLDPILGMNIINPLVSSTSLKEKLMGRISISTLKVKQFLETPTFKESDWITGGAIVNKMIRTSQKGNQYCVWHLTDLKGDIKTVCVFLFGSAYKEHWKICVGAVVGILNPTVMDGRDKSEATLRVDNAQKVLLIGMSRDYGLCKSKKKNGENCLSVVNKSKSEYCVHHIKKEYKKACRRSDLQPPKIGRSIDNLRAKVLGKTQVYYGGKTYTGVTGKKSVKQVAKDERTIKLLSERVPGPLSEPRVQRDASTLKTLSKNPKPVSVEGKDSSAPSKPESKLVDLEFTITRKERNAAKASALKYIREHGPLRRYSEKTKRTEEQISSLKRKLDATNETESKRAKTSDTPTHSLKEKHIRNGINDEFLKLMNSESRNSELLKAAECSEREKYFDKLETREKMETKMASTFKIECKAVRCLKCNYKSFSASDLCKTEKHPLRVVNAIKRFWKCGNCSGRTVCLELIPLHSCKVCGSSKWERASMMPEKKDLNLIVEKLSLRGDEEKFVGAVVNQANLNLLVPEGTI